MGRMRKQTADYFPHFTYKGRTLTVLESKWGCVGYTFWYKLLELLCESDGHCYDCSIPTNLVYLSIKAMTDEETATTILNTLSDMGKIDTRLWQEKKIVWCQSLVDRLATSLYAKRITAVPKKPLLDGEVREEQEEKPPSPPPKPLKQQRQQEEEKPKKKEPDKQPAPPKKHYAEFVELTEDEYKKLVDKYGEERTRLYIQKLDNAKGAKGYKYKSDYRAILNWVVEEVNSELQRKGGYGRGNEQPVGSPQPSGFKPSGGFRGSEN